MDTTITLTAHRGYRAKFPENTMLGFREALKLDIDSIEMDVHMTRDRQIVVMHDAALDRSYPQHDACRSTRSRRGD